MSGESTFVCAWSWKDALVSSVETTLYRRGAQRRRWTDHFQSIGPSGAANVPEPTSIACALAGKASTPSTSTTAMRLMSALYPEPSGRPTRISGVLHVHRAERADALVDALRELLASPPSDPFAAEVVAVPTRGMERWLTQRMSARLGASAGRTDGVCANVEFPSPRAVVGEAVAAASGLDPDADPWLPERAVWPLLELVDASLGEPWLARLAAHLGVTANGRDPGRAARRFSAVRHLAGLYDRYAVQRPDMLRAWARGEDADGAGRPLPPDAIWQAALWRRLRDRIAQPDPAERLERACARPRAEPAVAALPDRLALFGLTRLPAARLRVLRALAERRDVHLFLLHPSSALWAKVAEATRSEPPPLRRRADTTATLPANRLLASWGQDARELQLVLAAGAGDAADHHHPVRRDAGTLLARLQEDVRADRAPAGPPLPGEPEARPRLDPDDRSVQVHACHGRARQVEVLRDALLHLLADDPSLEPRDVIVMCPDIETFAPLIHATFGAGDVGAEDEDERDALSREVRPPDLRVRLADRALRQTNPVLGVVAQLIDLVEQRLTASQILDLADREPVRRRFRLDDDDLARLQDWVAASGIRWGLDAEHRRPFKLDTLPAGTWGAGLDRLLLGVTMTEEEHRLFGDVLPLDDVESGAIDLAGRLAELVDRLRAALDALSAPQPVATWAEALAAAADALTATAPREAWQREELQRGLDGPPDEAGGGAPAPPPAAATAPREAWQREELQRVLDDLADEAAGESPALAPAEIRVLLSERLQGRPTRANFRTGHLTICTLVPMRSVPHRVVCLLGMDDTVFPRRGPRDGDDLILDDPHVGDRDGRTEDRQMLLDALMAAGERLVVTYTGNDERTNVERPPAVPVGELLDVIERTVRVEAGDVRDRVVVRHPLQPFDARNFQAGALAGPRAWSFDRVMLDGARALAGSRAAAAPFLAGPLPPRPAPVLELEDLVRFVERPVRAFLRQRLGLAVGGAPDEIEDGLPVELGGLELWGVGQRLLDARLAGTDGRTAIKAEIARGTLPPGQLGMPVVRDVWEVVEEIVAAAGGPPAADAAPVGSVDVRAALPDGRTLSGTVPGVAATLLRAVTYSRVTARHRLVAWVRLLALTAARPEVAFEAVTIGRARQGAHHHARVSVARIAPPPAEAPARRGLAPPPPPPLADLYARGMREPLPLACLSSAAYAAAAAAGADAPAAARAAWEEDRFRPE